MHLKCVYSECHYHQRNDMKSLENASGSKLNLLARGIKWEIHVFPRTIEGSLFIAVILQPWRVSMEKEGSWRVTGERIQYGRWSIRFHGPSTIRQICYWIPSCAISVTTEIPVNVRKSANQTRCSNQTENPRRRKKTIIAETHGASRLRQCH